VATLRLFANLRESAGTDRVVIDAGSVGELLESASDRFGDGFTTGLVAAGVWVNGEVADRATTISDNDEVALIPPVSGGAMSMASAQLAPNILSVALVVALLAVAWADPKWFVIVAVGSVMAWVWDLADTAAGTASRFAIFPALAGSAASGAFAYAWGFAGYAGATAVGVVIAVSWPIFDRSSRDFSITALTTLVTLVSGAAAGSLVLVRLIGTHAVVGYVLVTVLALVGAWAAHTYGSAIQSLDANVGALLGALLAGLVAGLAIAQLDVSAGLLGGVAAAAGVIGGRALGSVLRTGHVTHTEDAPGALAMFDGAIVAAPLFWLAIWLFG